MTLPSGTVTFLFTDIEGSTQLWEKYPESMKSALAQHDLILHEAIESNHGYVIKTTGDGIHSAFETAIDAINATVAAQYKFQYPISDLPIKVRMGLHTGEAELRAGDYFGQALNRAARIMAVGYGGQILLSSVTADLAREHLPANVSLLDLGEHRLKDLTRQEHIFQLIAPDLSKDFPALKSLNSLPNNLPLQLTSLIGRARELTEASKLLASTRLLTFVGPGGTGKTRLSLQLAADSLGQFPDGVWLLELAPLTEASLILQSLASIFSLRAQVGMPVNEIILNYLRAKNLLLILDNCEHLIEACAQLADRLLLTCSNLKIIVSSREALGIRGEVVFRVPSLALPDQTLSTSEALASYESVQLFVERVRAIQPKFHLTEENVSSVVQICRRLDGIPLALELAAARVIMFSPEQIAARLDDRFRLLTGGSRTAMPRQQTLRALIDWSYELLSEDERALLRRLSIFAGGWTFEEAETIFSDLDILSLLRQLVNKSMIAVVDEGEVTRYYLLETIRQYARDKLLESGEAKGMRDRHLDYFVKLAEAAAPHLDQADAIKWLKELEAEHDNFRTALEWGMEQNLEAVLRIAVALPSFWFRRGYEVEGRQWLEAALAHIDTLPKLDGKAARQQTLLVANAWGALSYVAFSQGDSAHAITYSEKSAALSRQLGDNTLLAKALGIQVSSNLVTGNFAGIDDIQEEAVIAARASGDKAILGMTLGLLTPRLMVIKGESEITRAFQQESLALLKESGNRWALSMVLMGLGLASRYQRRFKEAREQFTILLPIFHETGDRHRANMMQSELAHMERYEGHFEKAEQKYRETILEWQRLGHRAAVAHQLECFAFLAKTHEKSERAAKLFGAAEALREKIEIPMTVMERDEYEHEVADLRANMDEKAFANHWAEGRALTMDEAINFALETAR